MDGYGYAGNILHVSLNEKNLHKLPTLDYADKFLGGRGIAARLYWELVPPDARAFDPENCLIAMTGPVTGFTGISGGSRWQICGKSPVMEPEAFSYANLGERWGSWLKYAGYDGLIVQGKSEKPVYLYITNDTVEIRDASHLWGKTSFEVGDALKEELGSKVSVLTIGPAAENLVTFATLITDDGASGASGLGSVMGSKNLKAIVVYGDQKPVAADPERLKTLIRKINNLRKDTWKGWHEDIPGKTKKRNCYGCASGCFRKSYQENGKSYKFFCQAVHVYWGPAHQYAEDQYAEDGEETALLAMRLCDRYGLDTTIMQPIINWLNLCYQEGVLTEDDTGLSLSKIGSAEFIEDLTRKIAFRESFGDLLARGILKAAEELGPKAKKLTSAEVITGAGETRDYDPRMIPTNGLLYALEQRRPINQLHETSHSLWLWLKWLQKDDDGFLSYNDLLTIARNFWGGPEAADYTTYEGKALAAKKIQDRSYAKESLILCDFLWPVIWVRFADDHTGDPTLESQLVTAITGREIDEESLNFIGERVFNMQRAVLLRQGWPGRDGDKLLDFLHEEPLDFVFFNPDLLVPGKNGQPVSVRGNKVNRQSFENLKDEYYSLRGWDVTTGIPTREKLEELGLADLVNEL